VHDDSLQNTQTPSCRHPAKTSVCRRGSRQQQVGHTNIGARRVVYLNLTRLQGDIASGSFYKNKA
jgi:bisphosphoglycerate-independent phosphoglycerate mutase (AlkP superfamily)